MLVACGAVIRGDHIATCAGSRVGSVRNEVPKMPLRVHVGVFYFLKPKRPSTKDTPEALLFRVAKAIHSPDGQGGDAFRPGASWHRVKEKNMFFLLFLFFFSWGGGGRGGAGGGGGGGGEHPKIWSKAKAGRGNCQLVDPYPSKREYEVWIYQRPLPHLPNSKLTPFQSGFTEVHVAAVCHHRSELLAGLHHLQWLLRHLG